MWERPKQAIQPTVMKKNSEDKDNARKEASNVLRETEDTIQDANIDRYKQGLIREGWAFADWKHACQNEKMQWNSW